jgi:DNA-binding PadR family transcriptional regulator
MKLNPSHRDKRSKLDLELFVLALVQRETNTPYLLREAVGLSPGATIPVLKRLQEVGYVRPGKPAARGRIEFKITASGKQYLASGWRPLLEASVPGNLEAILRIASLALLSGADKKIVSASLKRAAAMKSTESKRRKKGEAGAIESSLPSFRDVGLYSWMQAAHKEARLAAEGKVLRQLAIAILRLT